MVIRQLGAYRRAAERLPLGTTAPGSGEPAFAARALGPTNLADAVERLERDLVQEAMSRAGGLLKGVDPAPLVERHATRLRAAILIGVDRSELLSAFERHAPGVPVVEVEADETGEVMSAAVRAAASAAHPGDVVLLAPAAA